MTQLRRTFLGCVASLLALCGVGVAAVDPPDFPEIPDEPTDEQRPNWKKDLFLVVTGGSMIAIHRGPPQDRVMNPGASERDFTCVHDSLLPPVLTMRPCWGMSHESGTPPTTPRDEVWFETPRGGNPEWLWPRTNSFSVSHQIVIGTIDEMVEDYRKMLEHAAKQYLHCGDESMQTETPLYAGERGRKNYRIFQELLKSHHGQGNGENKLGLKCGHLDIPFNEPEMARFDAELAAANRKQETANAEFAAQQVKDKHEPLPS